MLTHIDYRKDTQEFSNSEMMLLGLNAPKSYVHPQLGRYPHASQHDRDVVYLDSIGYLFLI